MRDKRFNPEHLSRPLIKNKTDNSCNRQSAVPNMLLTSLRRKTDERAINTLKVAETWRQGEASVDDAIKAAYGIIALAKELTNPVAIAVARPIGANCCHSSHGGSRFGWSVVWIKSCESCGKIG